jgi:uncharacterized protein YbcC (UPF0753/DUF2309 family)
MKIHRKKNYGTATIADKNNSMYQNDSSQYIEEDEAPVAFPMQKQGMLYIFRSFIFFSHALIGTSQSKRVTLKIFPDLC